MYGSKHVGHSSFLKCKQFACEAIGAARRLEVRMNQCANCQFCLQDVVFISIRWKSVFENAAYPADQSASEIPPCF